MCLETRQCGNQTGFKVVELDEMGKEMEMTIFSRYASRLVWIYIPFMKKNSLPQCKVRIPIKILNDLVRKIFAFQMLYNRCDPKVFGIIESRHDDDKEEAGCCWTSSDKLILSMTACNTPSTVSAVLGAVLS